MRRDDYLSCLFILFPHIGNVFSTHTSFQSHFLILDLFFHDYHLQQSDAQSIIFGRCLYKKEYEPEIIIIRSKRSKLSLTVLQLTDLHTNRCRFQDKRTSLKVSEHRYRIFYLRGSGTFLMSESCQL